MYPHQSERLTSTLERRGFSALVATTPENLEYVTGFRSAFDALDRPTELFGVFTRRGTALVVPTVEAAGLAAEPPGVDHVHSYGDFHFAAGEPPVSASRRVQEILARRKPTAADALSAALDDLGVTTGPIGLDEDGLTPPAWRHTVERLAARRPVESAAAFGEARAVKGPWEMQELERALHITEESINAVIQMLQPGVTEQDATTLCETEVARRGAAPRSVVILFGDRTALPAAAPSGRTLKRGDLVRLDVGCTYHGYWSAIGRTAVMGPPTPRQEEIHTATHAALKNTLDALRPGVPAHVVFETALEATRKDGVADFGRNHVGHGIGLVAREAPTLGPDDVTPLEAGMVLCVETPYYEPGWGGFSVKDTVLITRDTARVLNRSLRGLILLD